MAQRTSFIRQFIGSQSLYQPSDNRTKKSGPDQQWQTSWLLRPRQF